MTFCGHVASSRNESSLIIGVVSAHGGAKPNPYVTAARARLGRSAHLGSEQATDPSPRRVVVSC